MHGAIPRGATHAPAALAIIAAAFIVGACSKGEPESKQVKPNVPIPITGPKAAAGEPSAGVDEALKERLARQEAASRMFERNVLQPTPPRAAEAKAAPGAPPPAAAAAPQPVASEPTRTAVATPPPPPPDPVKAPPSQPAVTVPAAAVAPPPVAAPKAPAARVDLAAAKPTSAPEPAAPRLLSRVEPEFPTEAVRAGVEQGTVLAKLTLDGRGNVTLVEILNANPRRVFDRSVVRALGQWKFNEGTAGRTVESEISFRK